MLDIYRSLRALERETGLPRRYIRKLLPLALLAPHIIEHILDGTAPRDLSVERLWSHALLEWEDQRRVLGFPT